LFFDLERRYEEFRRVSDGHSSRGSLTTKLLATLQVVLPPAKLLDRFDQFAEPMVARMAALRREIRSLSAIRDCLLPKLISGELRVEDAERQVMEAV
jgi:type I restriction enzyme S subunit